MESNVGRYTRSVAGMLVGLSIAGTPSLFAAPFQNLDFEQAVIIQAPPTPSFPIYADAALPHWTARYDTTVCSTIWAQPDALDETSIALVSNVPYILAGHPFPPIRHPLQGNFSVNLSGYFNPPKPLPSFASLSQVGDIPANAQSITFYIGDDFGVPSIPMVYLDNTMISVFPISTTSDITLWAGNVAPWAGTTRELVFAAIGSSAPTPQNENYYDLDTISFSPLSLADLGVTVPEPGCALGLLGTLALLRMRRRR